VKKQIKTLLLILILILTFPSLSIAAENPDFNDLETVLDTFADSRKTRDLKEHGAVENKEAFTKTLEKNVYKPVDDAVIKHLEQMPEYAGKRMVTHDFRTPGKDGASVNTDRDVRVLVEVELDRWIEVPVNKWEDVYYKEFAQKTGMKVDDTTPPDAIKKHASKYRQLPTDRFHMEAGADYSDVGTIKVFEVNGQTKVVSTPNVVRTKKGFTRLKDPEGLAKMYLEKADEQYRQAKDIEQQMKDGGLSNDEMKILHDKLEMHEIEGTVQLKKGVETLEALREGYKKQGYDVGKLPDTFEKAITEIKKVDGTSSTDIKKLKADISALEPNFIKDLGDVNKKVSSQIESLKIVKKKASRFKAPDISLEKAGKAAGIAGDILSIKDALDKAEQGSHLFINFDKKDSDSEKAIKTITLAAIELSPIPVIDAMERGWQVDEEEQKYLKDMMERGEYGDWKTHPVTSMARVSTKIIYRTVSSMTIDPLISGKTAVKEGKAAVKDITNNFIADFTRQESAELQKLKFDAFVERSEKFELSEPDLFVNRGLYFGHVIPGDKLDFFSNKNETWTSDYILQWELVTPEGKVIKIKETPASEENAGNLNFTVPELSFGEYKVILRSFERSSGLQAGFTERSFKMNAKTDLGQLKATLGTHDGEPVKDEVSTGDAVVFTAAKLGEWSSLYKVEWLVDGERYKKESATSDDSNRFILKTDDLKPGIHSVAVRMLMETPFGTSIAAHQKYDLKIEKYRPELSPFKLAGYIEKETLVPLDNTDVQNTDILRFTAKLKPVKSREPIVTTLFWQVYDGNGAPLGGLSKQVALSEIDPEKEYTFRFRADNFSDGKYFVALTHQFVSDPENRLQASKSFRVQDTIKIVKAFVTSNRASMQPKDIFYPDQDPIFMLYYDLAPEIQSASVIMSIMKNGQLLKSEGMKLSASGTPPFHAEFAIPDGLAGFKGNDTGLFRAEITDSSNNRKNISREFKVVDYSAELIIPQALESGQTGQFSIKVPDRFIQPYSVVLNPGSGLSLGHNPGKLNGTITGIADKADKSMSFNVQVTDAVGRVARAENSIKIKAKKDSIASDIKESENLSAVIGPGESRDVHQRGKDRWHETVKQFIAQIPPCLQGEFSNWAWGELIKLGDDRARQEYIGNLNLAQVETDRAGVFAHTGGFWADDLAKKPYNKCSAQWIENMRDAGFITYSKAWNALNSMWKNAKYDGTFPGPRSEAEARARKQAWDKQISVGTLKEVPVNPAASQSAFTQRPQRPQRPGPSVNAASLGQSRAKEIVDAIMRDIPTCMGDRSTIRRRFETDMNRQINALGGLSAAEFQKTKAQLLTGAAKNNLNMLKEGGFDSCEREWLSNYQRSGLLSSGEINKAVQEEERYYVVFTLEGDKGRDWVTPTSWDVVARKPITGLFDRFPKKYATKGYAYKRWVVAVGPVSRKKAEMYCDKARQGKVVITANYTPWLPTGNGTGYEMNEGEYIAKSIGVVGGF